MDWSWAFSTAAKVIEETSFQSAGGNLLRIRSTADLQRCFDKALEANAGVDAIVLRRWDISGASGRLEVSGHVGFGKSTVTQMETRWNIRMEFPFGTLLLVYSGNHFLN